METRDSGTLLDPARHARRDSTPPREGSVPAGTEYHRVLTTDQRRIGRGILAIIVLLGPSVRAVPRHT